MPLTLEQIAQRVELKPPITPPEAAMFVGVSPETVITWIKDRLLKGGERRHGQAAQRPHHDDHLLCLP